jgi:hypothetical protein
MKSHPDFLEVRVMNEPKGYWSSVFYQSTLLMKQRPQMGGETAFWMARGMVDKNIDGSAGHAGPTLPLKMKLDSRESLVLAP